MVYRIKDVREKTVRDNEKYVDVTVMERLLRTRNLFRRRVKEEKQGKVDWENNLLMKRLTMARSSYDVRTRSASKL